LQFRSRWRISHFSRVLALWTGLSSPVDYGLRLSVRGGVAEALL